MTDIVKALTKAQIALTETQAWLAEAKRQLAAVGITEKPYDHAAGKRICNQSPCTVPWPSLDRMREHLDNVHNLRGAEADAALALIEEEFRAREGRT